MVAATSLKVHRSSFVVKHRRGFFACSRTCAALGGAADDMPPPLVLGAAILEDARFAEETKSAGHSVKMLTVAACRACAVGVSARPLGPLSRSAITF